MKKNRTKQSSIIRAFCGILGILLLLCSLSSCSKPPEFSEIRERFEELVLASGEINTIFYGVGLPTYERVTDPRETTKTYQKEATGEIFHYYELTDEVYGRVLAYRLFLENSVYVDPQSGTKYFYYQIFDVTYGRIMVAKSADGEKEYYLQLLDEAKQDVIPDYIDAEQGIYGYLLSDFSYDRNYKEESAYAYVQVVSTADSGRTAIYADEAEGIWCYLLPEYKEPVFESYYSEDDPTDYDYVTVDSPYGSIDQIKMAAEAVYSEEYLSSIYNSLFVGTVGADQSLIGLSARYMEYTDENGSMSLMMSNTYRPLISETRQYLFDTATIIKPANSEFVTIAVDSYLPSKPDEILNVTVTMVLQDGVWLLDQPTY